MIHPTDTTTLTAAASALRHAPASMRAAHLAERLEEMARRVEAIGRVAALLPAVLDSRGRNEATIRETLTVGGEDA